MAAAATLNFEKCQLSRLHEDICTKFGRKMHHGHAEMTRWSKCETGN